MGLIGTLVRDLGYVPSSLAYIKPATQCKATQLVALYCESLGVDHAAVGQIVYYKGFTRAFLAGESESTTNTVLRQAGEAVDAITKLAATATSKTVLIRNFPQQKKDNRTEKRRGAKFEFQTDSVQQVEVQITPEESRREEMADWKRWPNVKCMRSSKHR